MVVEAMATGMVDRQVEPICPILRRTTRLSPEAAAAEEEEAMVRVDMDTDIMALLRLLPLQVDITTEVVVVVAAATLTLQDILTDVTRPTERGETESTGAMEDMDILRLRLRPVELGMEGTSLTPRLPRHLMGTTTVVE